MRPSAASAWISFQNSRRALGSTPAVGSSSSRSCGLGSVQAPSASRCFQPPDSSPASCSSRPASPSRSIIARAAAHGVGDPVEARDEFQVLAHREILVEAEALRHVADMALDLVGFGADVVAETGAAALVRGQQPAQHADGGGLARAVGAEEAVDSPRFTRIDRLRTTVRLPKDFVSPSTSMAMSGAAVTSFTVSVPSVTLTGCPTRSRSGRVRPRLDQEHELGALLQAVDHRRRELRLRAMKLTLAVRPRLAAVAADGHGLADRELGQHRLVDEEAHLQVGRRQQRDDRLAGRHQLADAVVDSAARCR